MKTLNPAAVGRVLKRLHYPLEVILTCVRWYGAYPLSLRQLEEMMAERGVSVDHSDERAEFTRELEEIRAAYRAKRNFIKLVAKPS